MSYKEDSGAQEPEDMEENVKCDLCQEEVEEGDNYRLHLVDKHNVTMKRWRPWQMLPCQVKAVSNN